VTALAVVVSSTWIAICAGAPEFIWGGFLLAYGHTNATDIVGAVLVGLILAFFVEPLVQGVRDLVHRGDRTYVAHRPASNVFFAASLAFAFALAAVCIHDSIVAFVSTRLHPVGPEAALDAGIQLTLGWALVPFAISLAWFAARAAWPARILSAVAAASPVLAGLYFGWSLQSILTTAIPCAIILGFGFRTLFLEGSYDLRACARTVALIGGIWLIGAGLFDAILALFGGDKLFLYSTDGYWVDARFYLGWSLGLLLAPSPFENRATRRQRINLA
jgi:hypothetical protein